MLSTVLTKTFLDRWKGEAIGALTLVALFLLGMLVYRDIDLSVYTDLPEAFRRLMNIPADADVGALAYGAIYSSYGALTITGLAVSMGAASIAGEEQNGTIGLLLGNPKSRSHVLVSKAANVVLLTSLGSVVLWIGGVAVPALLGVDITGIHVAGLVLHMFAIAVFHGFLALAIGAWTGKSSLASGVSAAVVILSFFAVGLLPLFESIADGVRMFPWYYFSGSQPHLNGIAWGHMAVLLAGIALLAVCAVVGVNRRDLRSRNTGAGILDQLRSHRLTRRVADRLAGSARVSSIWAKTASEHQGVLIVVAYVMFLVMGVVIGTMYNAIDEALIAMTDAFPEGMMALFGGGDLGTPEGFYQIETFGLMAPTAFMVVTVAIGARALAGEEGKRTMGLLLANPIKRSTVVLEKTVAMVIHASVVGAALFLGVLLGSIFGGLGMSAGNIAAATVLATLLGLVFGGLSLALGAATGRMRLAVYATVGVAVVSFVANGFLPLSDGLEGVARWQPVHYYLSSDPLVNGMNWVHALVLLGLFSAVVVAAVALFDRRDLRRTG